VSSFANDAAWSLLTDKVDKALPLLVPLAMAGYGAYQGYRNVRDNRITDPVLGVVGKEGDDSLGSNLAEFGTGFTQGLGAGALGKLGAKGAGKIAGAGAKRFGASRAARQGAASHAARQQTSRELTQNIGAQPYLGPGFDPTTYTARMGREAATQAGRRGAGRQAALSSAQRGAQRVDNAIDLGRTGKYMGAGLLGAGLFGAGFSANEIYDRLTNPNGSGGPNDPNQMSGGTTGFGTGFGGAGGGVSDISNVQGNAMAGNQIFDPNAFSGNSNAVAFENQKEFGGLGMKQKGENMFVNNKGNEIKKEVTDLMYKAKCSACDKEDCLGKMHCGGMNKAKDSKKPAHGMVIVIGSKAGPGPSKDGKREKLDSEKKEE